MEKENKKTNYKKIITKIKILGEKVFNYLKKNHVFKLILKAVGLIIITVSAFLIFLETLGLLIINSNVAQFEIILNSFYDFKLFDYISHQIFYLLMFGGYLIDVSFWIIIILFGYWLYLKKNLFKRKIVFGIILALTLGITLFSFGLFYAFPGIKVPLEKIIKVEYLTEISKGDLKYEKEDLNSDEWKHYYKELPNNSGYIKAENYFNESKTQNPYYQINQQYLEMQKNMNDFQKKIYSEIYQ